MKVTQIKVFFCFSRSNIDRELETLLVLWLHPATVWWKPSLNLSNEMFSCSPLKSSNSQMDFTVHVTSVKSQEAMGQFLKCKQHFLYHLHLGLVLMSRHLIVMNGFYSWRKQWWTCSPGMTRYLKRIKLQFMPLEGLYRHILLLNRRKQWEWYSFFLWRQQPNQVRARRLLIAHLNYVHAVWVN